MNVGRLVQRVNKMIVMMEQRALAEKNRFLKMYKVMLFDEDGNLTYETPEEELAILPRGCVHKIYLFDPDAELFADE